MMAVPMRMGVRLLAVVRMGLRVTVSMLELGRRGLGRRRLAAFLP